MSGYGVSLDAVSGVVHAVRTGWGEYGYRVQDITGTLDGSALAEISHSDGSTFFVAVDCYGQAVGQGFDTIDAAQAALLGHYAGVTA